MTKYARMFLVGMFITCLLILSTVGVAGALVPYQATETGTPTPTITAVGGYLPSVAPTVFYDQLDCGTGTPIGYGSVTPDSLWSVLCANCVYTPMPSSTVNPTLATELAMTASSTPSPTLTPVASSQLLYCNGPLGGYAEVSCTELNEYTLLYSLNEAYETDVYFAMDWNKTLGATITSVRYVVDLELSSAPSIPCENCNNGWLFYANPAMTGLVGFLQTKYLGNGYTDSYHVDSTVAFITDANYAWGLAMYGGPLNEVTGSIYVVVNGYPFMYGTPTPSSGSYCAVVNGGGSPITDTGFSWTGIEYGSQTCFDIGPIDEWDFGWITFSNINIPWIAHLCLQEIDIGVITLFGVSVSLLVIAYVVGVLMIIRNMFVS